MRKAFTGIFLLLAGLSLAQGVDYRQAALAAAALSRLQAVAQAAGGEARLLAWAKEVKAQAEKSYEAKAYFQATREAQAALLLFRAAQGEPQGRARASFRPAPSPMAPPQGWGFRPWHCGCLEEAPRSPKVLRASLAQRAQAAVDRAEKELAYYRSQNPMPKELVAEAKERLAKEPGRTLLLARAALALVAAERGF